MEPYLRRAVVAGRFYAGSAAGLKGQVEQCIIKDAVREEVVGVVSPHAGLMYSGRVAGAVFSSIEFPDTFLLLGPNHTGRGAAASIMSSGRWEIPTGRFSIDEDLGGRIALKSPLVSEDVHAHIMEHSIEVQLPFIAHFTDSVKIVPVTIMNASVTECEAIGKGIADAISETGRKVIVVASSDMSHYVPDDAARRLDALAIERVLNLDPEGLYNVVLKERITMCGFIPVTIMLYAAKTLGAKEARLVRYATSGETSGDFDRVVGYAGIIIK